jgi:hypothetical protein
MLIRTGNGNLCRHDKLRSWMDIGNLASKNIESWLKTVGVGTDA